MEAIRPGGLAQQKAPRIQAALRTIREQRGDYSLEFLGDMPALEARDWLTAIDGIGRKTAVVVLLFSFGTPLMPVDRHVERVAKRIGLMPAQGDRGRGATSSGSRCWRRTRCTRPTSASSATADSTCHARNPACDSCPIAPRCRYLDRRAP